MRCAPDDPLSHYNLGVYHQNRGELMRAVAAYETAVRLEPTVPALVNVAMIYARLGRTSDAEQALRRAVELEPTSPAANFNLALLLVDQGRAGEAERGFRAALEIDPTLAEAAHSLALLLANTRPEEALAFCRRAAALRPDEPRYAYSLARLLRRDEDLAGTAGVLRRLLQQSPGHEDARRVLADVEAEMAQRGSEPDSPGH